LFVIPLFSWSFLKAMANVILIVDVIAPTGFPPAPGLLIVLNLHMHYYACVMPPGFAIDVHPPQPGDSFLMARPRHGGGQSWNGCPDGRSKESALNIPPAKVTTCRT
jgi:hypothetical protein